MAKNGRYQLQTQIVKGFQHETIFDTKKGEVVTRYYVSTKDEFHFHFTDK